MIDPFAPYKIGNLEVKNRWVRSATWDGSADESGAVTDKSVSIYQELGRGGVGLIMSGYAFVSDQGQANPGQYGVHNDDMIPGLRWMAKAAHEGGAKIALQIVHAGINSVYLGRKGIDSLAMSRMPGYGRPHREMTAEDIEGIIEDFIAAASRAIEAGFDAIQLHGAHSYLMSQIESPLFNRRKDQWGGNAENRRRFHLEVIRKIRRVIGADFPLWIKFGLQDDKQGGLSLAEGLETCRQMVTAGIESIEVSTGVGNATPMVKENDGECWHFRERTVALKQVVDVPIMAVGGIRSLEMARGILDNKEADMISMCRSFVREPSLITRWQNGDDKQAATCISCNRCLGVLVKSKVLECGEDRRLREVAAKVSQ